MTDYKAIAIQPLLEDIKVLIEQGRRSSISKVNTTLIVTYWQVGKRINEEVLLGKRAKYGKQVVDTIAKELVLLYGKSFESKNLRRMMQFSSVFSDIEIVVPLARKLSWSHFLILIPLKSNTAEFGKGFNQTNLKLMRQFYLAFPKSHTLCDRLTWSHYRLLVGE